MKKVIFVLLITVFLFCGCTAPQILDSPSSTVSGEGLEVHFIDVGQADSALVICDGKTMLIDGGNAADSSLLYSYLDKYSIDVLDYVVLSHAHEDHVGGLPGAFRHSDVGRVFAPLAESDTECYKNFLEAVSEQGLSVENPIPGERFLLGSATVEMLGPIDNAPEELNNTSIVLKVTYGEVSVLFTGDAEYEAEKLLLNSGADLESTVLKAPHHGSETSSCYEFLREVMPEYIVISVGQDNSYGHPHDSVLSRYEALGAEVLRTDVSGNIIMKSDGAEIDFEVQKQSDDYKNKAVRGEGSTPAEYIGNKNSKVYHAPSCDGLPKEKNRVYFTSKEDAESEKYHPCSNCLR